MKRHLFADEDGFSLTELMVVIVIVGILALLALPRFMNVTTRAKMTEAKTMLKQIHTLQQGFYYEHDRYARSIDELGFEQTRLITDGGSARYALSIHEGETGRFEARATSVVDFDQDGSLNVWSVNEEGMITELIPD